MPICLTPNRTFRVVLDGDKNQSPQPAFLCRYLTLNEFQELAELNDKGLDAATSAEAISLLIDAIAFATVGWEHMGDCGEYAPEKLRNVLTLGEAKELSMQVMQRQRVSGDDRGNSPSPSPSSSANSAEAAAPANA